MKCLLVTALLILLASAPRDALAVDSPKPRVLLLGDSLMRVGVGPVLKKSLRTSLGVKADMRARSATGLTRDDVYDWPAEAAKLVKDNSYDRAIVFLGANDCQNFTLDGKVIPFGSDAWRDAYRSRVRSLMGALCGNVKEVLWLGLPPMRSPKLNQRIADLQQTVELEVAASTCGKYIPTAEVLGGADRAYLESRKINRRRVLLREKDGVHITQNGGQLVWETLLDKRLRGP
jgi:uncharacterized protein